MWKAYNNLMGVENMKKACKIISIALVVAFVLYFLLYWLQNVWAHRNGLFRLDYRRVTLNQEVDYETVFLQTGLGKNLAKKLMEDNEFDKILDIQEKFWGKSTLICKPVFGLFSRVDKVSKEKTPDILDLQPGDILLTLSTHSAGWHHGHVGLVLDDKRVLECVKWGKTSEIVKVGHWQTYSNYAVLRVKEASAKLRQKVATYTEDNLCGVPYRLSVGVVGKKFPNIQNKTFGTHCGHCVWYAWKQFGYDLDSDGGRIVTPYDLLQSEHLEIVQIYGMNPRDFL